MPASFVGETGEIATLHLLRNRHAAEASASTDFEEVLGAAAVTGTVTGARFIPDAAMTGATATALTLNINNKTATLVPATFAFITGQNLVAFTPFNLTLGAAAAVAVTAGDILTLQKTHAGGGTQGVAGVIEVTISRGDTL